MARRLKTIALSFALVASCAYCQGGSNRGAQPAASAEELGKMVARAMLAGNSDMVEPCLPPYRAYAPILRALAVGGEATEEALREYYDKELAKLREDIRGFPQKAKAMLGFDPGEVREIEVQAEAQRKQFVDVRVTFKLKDRTFVLRLDECLLYEGHWYLVDID